jgi:hypothetical protein
MLVVAGAAVALNRLRAKRATGIVTAVVSGLLGGSRAVDVAHRNQVLPEPTTKADVGQRSGRSVAAARDC